MMAKASTVFHAGGRTVASMGNRSPARSRRRRDFLACARQSDTWTSWPARIERSASRTTGIRGKRSVSRLDFAAMKDDSEFASLKALLVLHSSVKRQKDLKARL